MLKVMAALAQRLEVLPFIVAGIMIPVVDQLGDYSATLYRTTPA